MTRLRLASAIPVLGAILLAATPALAQAQPGTPPPATPSAGAPPPATPAPASATVRVTTGPALAMHGDIKYGPDFRNFAYADPSAPKGGEVRMGIVATTFDNFNPWILRGTAVSLARIMFDTLTVGSEDEPFTRYCLVCETMDVPEDRSWIVFNLRADARFHDGSPITPDDVIFSFNTLREHGHPLYRSYWSQVDRAERSGERGVRFVFKPGDNRELPLIIGELPILSRAYWQGRDFERTTLEPPLASGPYRIDTFEAGRFVIYRRVPDYWAINHPTRAGQYNFDVIRIDYYRDNTVALEAFKAGQFDMRSENSASQWANGYNVAAVQQGLIRREEIPVQRVAGMQGWAMNLRRPQFQDVRVRQALAYAYDFETANRTLFSGAYTRTRSYFDNSDLAARGLPGPEELRLLEPLRGRIPNEVFTTEYQPPRTAGTGIEGWRENRRIATQLLRDAGYRIVNQQLVNAQGQQLAFEILLNDPQFERIALPYVENLRALGIAARIRTVDTSQYQRRSDAFDYDMTVGLFGQSESPGNEQRDFWSCAARDTQGSQNLLGICDPAIDQLIDRVVQAPDRAGLVAATRALDRVLQYGFYVVPHWYLAADRVAFWDRFGRPARVERRVGYDPFTWWVDPQRDAALRARRGR
jgi:microcin C transport system substrate-binding protein